MVENQAYLFLVFSLTGVAIGILFDFFRILRKNFKTTDLITYIEDILFWILTGVLILYNIWYFNNGEIRLFMFLGIIMGIIIYMLTLSNFVIKTISFFVEKILKISKTIIKIILLPLKPIVLFFIKIFRILVKRISEIVKKRKKFNEI